MIFSFAPDVRVIIGTKKYSFVERSVLDGKLTWVVRHLRDGSLTSFTEAELARLYDEGELEYDAEYLEAQLDGKKKRARREKRLAELSDKDKARRKTMKAVLDGIEKETGNRGLFATVELPGGAMTTVLAQLLPKVCADAGMTKTISVSAFRRWKKWREDEENDQRLLGDMSSRGRKPMDPKTRSVVVTAIQEHLHECANKNKAGERPTFSMQKIKTKLAEKLKIEALHNRDAPSKPPSNSTLYRILRQFPSYDVDVARLGPVRARTLYRGNKGHEEVRAPLDLVEFDETLLDLFLFDEIWRIPLGRPWLAWWIDRYSRSILGFYVGFERPSDVVISGSLRHCCSLKSYVGKEYPVLKGEYLQGGLPRRFRLDNGFSQWSQTVEGIAHDIDADYDFCPVKTPWFKSGVENSFSVLNSLLLKEIPGFVHKRGEIDIGDYDPLVNGCIGFRHFLFILHAYIVDFYHAGLTETKLPAPNLLWEEGKKIQAPGMLDRAADLDVIFGIKRVVRLDHRGVRFVNIWYVSEELHEIRRACGQVLDVRISINPIDLGKVHAWHPKAECWVPAYSTKGEGKGISLHMWKLLEQVKRSKAWTDDDATLRAMSFMHEIIGDCVRHAQSVRIGSLAARAVGLGTEHVFSHLDHDGNLGALTGPFQGRPINPFSAVKPEILTPPPPKLVLPEKPIVLRSPAIASPPVPSAPLEDVPKPRRSIPSIAADRSLGGQQRS